LHAGRSRNDQVLARCASISATHSKRWHGAQRVADALDGIAAEQGAVVLPGYTHMQQAMPSSVALWAAGFAAEVRDDVGALAPGAAAHRENPLGSAAGYGTPHLPVDRDGTRHSLGLPENHEPVTAVQLSRGKGEAEVLFQVDAAHAGPRPARL
jgi:argininosuccinate lyase